MYRFSMDIFTNVKVVHNNMNITETLNHIAFHRLSVYTLPFLDGIHLQVEEIYGLPILAKWFM